MYVYMYAPEPAQLPAVDCTLVVKEEETEPDAHQDRWMRPPPPAPDDP